MCRYIYSLAACGHEFGAGMEKCEKYLAWEAEPDSKDTSSQCRNPSPEPHDMQTYEGDCYMCKQEFEMGQNLRMEDRREEAILIKRDMDEAILAAGGAYTGKQRYEILKRFEHNNQAFEVMFENAERELQSAKEELTRVRREADSAKKEVAEWKERYAHLLLDKKTRATMGEGGEVSLLRQRSLDFGTQA
ncbi:uncharacterized protein EAE97_000832 [Botrytis byssoidea]|uniref:Uncharacterized protein n=1 Tax=Botrytis byssoidea TaxID=139641 RepID=A0A9P5IZ20_9HELO|nr:uncharacterized protein EAE97_000832 [Botrytis byssoidea]KAF7953433.1 hypothetical protein EAE97_000832 [Botrytis byssoidea]